VPGTNYQFELNDFIFVDWQKYKICYNIFGVATA
jgi:hypothetical protein